MWFRQGICPPFILWHLVGPPPITAPNTALVIKLNFSPLSLAIVELTYIQVTGVFLENRPGSTNDYRCACRNLCKKWPYPFFKWHSWKVELQPNHTYHTYLVTQSYYLPVLLPRWCQYLGQCQGTMHVRTVSMCVLESGAKTDCACRIFQCCQIQLGLLQRSQSEAC